MNPQIPHPSPHFQTDRDFATQLDSSDPLAEFRSRFFVPDNKIYFDGNSLGLMPRSSAEAVQRVIDEWKKLAINAWFEADKPWIGIAERLGAEIAPLVGAEPDEVIATGTTTLNLHALVGTFYHPEGERTKILTDELTFPSDIYALRYDDARDRRRRSPFGAVPERAVARHGTPGEDGARTGHRHRLRLLALGRRHPALHGRVGSRLRDLVQLQVSQWRAGVPCLSLSEQSPLRSATRHAGMVRVSEGSAVRYADHVRCPSRNHSRFYEKPASRPSEGSPCG
jgi:hypothetical protein